MGIAGVDDTDGVNGQDGNAHINSFTFDISTTTVSNHDQSIP